MIEIDGKKRTICAWIPARGGSKGVPGKALRDLNGKPLIAYTIAAALEIGGADVVCVNTDDERIRDVALALGADAPFLRPSELAGDDSPLEAALAYQWDWYRRHRGFVADIHVGMSPTYPFRKKGRIDQALDLVRENQDIFNVRSLVQVPHPEDNFWLCEEKSVDRFIFSLDAAGDEGPLLHDCFAFNVVVDCRPHVPGSGPTPLIITDVESVDIDEIADLELARCIAAKEFAFDQASRSASRDSRPGLFGKLLDDYMPTEHERIIIHPDYPRITANDLAGFARFCLNRNKVVVAGCEIDTANHPYRLMRRFNHFYTRYAVDVPQSIRGRRQLYPRIYRYVPALVYLPGGCPPESLTDANAFLMYPLARNKCLDRTIALEACRI